MAIPGLDPETEYVLEQMERDICFYKGMTILVLLFFGLFLILNHFCR